MQLLSPRSLNANDVTILRQGRSEADSATYFSPNYLHRENELNYRAIMHRCGVGSEEVNW